MKKRRIGINILLALILSLALFAAFPAAGALAETIPDGTLDLSGGPDDNPGLEGQGLDGQSLNMEIQGGPGGGDKKIEVTFTKDWVGVTPGKEPAVTFQLQKKVGSGNWTDVANRTLQLDGTKDSATSGDREYKAWEGKFTDLPEKDGSKTIFYQVVELDVPDGYSVSGPAKPGKTITNTVKKIKICVTKEWSVKPGKKSEATFTLYSKVDGADWVSGPVLVLKSDNEKKVTGYFEKLPLIDANGNAISYKVEETSSISGDKLDFVSSNTGLQPDGDNKKITFTNTKVERIEVKFQKSWVDSVNQNANRPSVIFDLYANGVKQDKSVTLNGVTDSGTGDREDSPWHGVFTNLPDRDANGIITYTVQEQALPGYTCTSPYGGIMPMCDHPTPADPTFVNTRKTVEIKVTKKWELGEKLPCGYTLPTVTIILKQDGNEIARTQLAADGSYTFTKDDNNKPLPLYPSDGNEPHVYTIEEEGGWAGYTPVINWTDADGSDGKLACIVTNTRDFMDIQVQKVWYPYTPRGCDSITVALYRSDDVTNPLDTARLSHRHNWSAIFENLPTHSLDGSVKYEYSVDETAVPEGYQKTIAGPVVQGDKLIYTVYNIKEIDIPVCKVWVDVPGTQHDSVTIKLLANGQCAGTLTLTGGENNWCGVFENLPQYDQDGKVIKYTIREVTQMNKYHTWIEMNDRCKKDYEKGFTVTNKLKGEKISIGVEKVWLKDNDKVRPEAATFVLYGQYEGVEKYEVARADLTADEDGNWLYTFGKDEETGKDTLPAYEKIGNVMYEIEYSIDELAVEPANGKGRYEKTIDGFTIYNKYIPPYNPPHRDDPPEDPEEPEPPVIIIPEPEPPTDEIPDIDVPLDESPKTGDQRNLALPMALAMISVAAFFTMRRLVKDQVK